MCPPSAASCQSPSPCLPSPFNPSPNSPSPSLRDWPVGEISDTLSPLRERLESGLTSSPRASSCAARPRASSFSRPPEQSPVIDTIALHSYHSYARHTTSSSNPFSQEIPSHGSSPCPSSPLAGTSRSPGSYSTRPTSPRNAPMGCSPTSIHSTQSQSHTRRPSSQYNQSHFLPSQGSPPQAMTSPSSCYTRTQSLFQQSFGCPYAAHVTPSFPDDPLCRGISSTESRSHPSRYIPTLVSQSPVQDAQPVLKGDSTPLNEAPLRWWGGRGAWIRDCDTRDLHGAHIAGCGDLDGIKGFTQPGHSTPPSFRETFGRGRSGASMFFDDEIRTSFDGVVSMGPWLPDLLAPSFTRAPQSANAGCEVEGISVPRTAPVHIPPPVDEDLNIQNTRNDLVCCQLSHTHLVGSAGGSIPVQSQEPGHGEQRHKYICGRNRRLSDASVQSSVSYVSCMSGPSPSPSLLVSPSQSHASTFPSLTSLGIGIEKAEREELRSRTFWARPRKNSGSAMKPQNKGLGHGCGSQCSPSVRSCESDGSEGPREWNIKAREVVERSDTASKPFSAHAQEKDTVKHGSVFFRASPKQIGVLDDQLQRERYERTERCVSLAITSILPATTITKLSPVGQALVKARESVKYVGHEIAPVVKDTLSVSTDLLSLAPLFGIEEAAKALLSVWNACQKVDTNRLSCLRLAERCATLLYSVRLEMSEVNMETALTLDEPVEKLRGALAQIQSFLEIQLHRPFLKRYLRREEIARELVACNEAITDAGSRFGISVQIRTYHQVCSMMKESKRSSQEVQTLLALDHQIIQHYAMICGQQMQTWRGDRRAGFSGDNALGPTENDTPSPTYGLQLQLQSTTALSSAASKLISTELVSGSGENSATSTILSMEHTSEEMGASAPALPTPSATKRQTTATKTTAPSHCVLPLHVLAQVHRAQDSEDAAADEAALRGTLVGALNAHNDVEMVRCLQVARGEIPEAAETLRRMLGAGAGLEVDTDAHVASDQSDHAVDTRNTELDRNFIQSGIEAMTRLTIAAKLGNVGDEVEPRENVGAFSASKLPSWTITRYEVTRTRKIGVGFFSNVYLGHWKKLPVVIRVLTHSVPRDTFVRHVELWNALNHPNVLPLYGASSTVGDDPWFFVSKFCSGGNLVVSLKRARVEGKMRVGKEGVVCVDLLKSIHDIAEGMAYMHGRGVLHGDLRATNVLVDESGRCVLSDFGQCGFKSETQSDGQPEPHPIRWWAPERLLINSKPTHAADVYAFAMCCVEILGMGDLPWSALNDRDIQELVLDKDERPPIPLLASNNADVANAITNLVHSCWSREPDDRPSFATITSILEEACTLQDYRGSQIWEASTPVKTMSTSFTSPTDSSPEDELYETALESLTTDVGEESMDLTSPIPALRDGVAHSVVQVNASACVEGVKVPQHTTYVLEHQDRNAPAHSSATALAIDMRNEENYRRILGSNHAFHSSLTLPLWSPIRVELGAVGYLSKPRGEFITLLNAVDPLQSCEESLRRLPSLYGYGKFEVQKREDGKRSVAQRRLDAISGFLPFKARSDRSHPERIARQYTFPLTQGKPAAYLCVEKTVYRYMDRLEAPMMWFEQHVDLILEVCTLHHGIRREDLILVVGTLDAPDWAVFVSHEHSDGRAQFNAFASREKGEPWGVYTLERVANSANAGPTRWVDEAQGTFASKVSCVMPCAQDVVGDTVMLAGLRFGPGMEVPMMMRS